MEEIPTFQKFKQCLIKRINIEQQIAHNNLKDTFDIHVTKWRPFFATYRTSTKTLTRIDCWDTHTHTHTHTLSLSLSLSLSLKTSTQTFCSLLKINHEKMYISSIDFFFMFVNHVKLLLMYLYMSWWNQNVWKKSYKRGVWQGSTICVPNENSFSQMSHWRLACYKQGQHSQLKTASLQKVIDRNAFQLLFVIKRIWVRGMLMTNMASNQLNLYSA